MKQVLLLVHRIPYPPNKGDKIRSYHLLKYLAQRYRVHLGTFIDDADDWQHADAVRALCGETHFAALDPRRAKLRSLQGLLKGVPLSLDYYRDRGLQAWVERVLRDHDIDRVVVFSSAMAQYVESAQGARRIIDFVDIDSDKWRQYADKKPWPMSWLYRREGSTLLGYERRIARAFDASFFVSAAEADMFKSLAPESAAKTGYFNNGVDTAYFSDTESFENPFAAGALPIVFTGAMDYWPNVDAVKWFAEEIFPSVRQRHANAVFTIVGSRPTPEVRALERLSGVQVTGTVPDVRPYVANAALCVAPLRIARGIQNKVLEAMAMGKAVVVTPQALEGIAAQTGSEVLLAADSAQFVSQVSGYLDQPNAAIGRNARLKVERQYGWDSNLAKLDASLESGQAGAPQASSMTMPQAVQA
jgi:sugar transferase (PEP-CTERM/EpsH1 system associated)